MSNTKLLEWLAFLLVGTIWGSSFLWIKIALRELSPMGVVAYRVLFGALGTILLLRAQRIKIPRDPILWTKLFLFSLFMLFPFILISWSEKRIDSAVAAILNGSTPLAAIFLAHFFSPGERATRSKILGLVLGFAGVLVIFSPSILKHQMEKAELSGMLAMLLASMIYGAYYVFPKRYLKGVPPAIQAAGVNFGSCYFAWSAWLFTKEGWVLPKLPITWFATAWMGLLGTALAFALNLILVERWGSTRSSAVNYLFPVVGLALGVIFLGERPHYAHLVGIVLILGGIATIHTKKA